MKILLISGHGNGDSGAIGNGYQEANLTRELVNLIAPKLKKYATVDVYDQSRNAFKDVQSGSFNIARDYNYVLEIHFNASNGQGHGTECYVTDREKGITVEQSIMKRLGKYFTLRDNDSVFDGVKRTNFLVISTVKSMGISGALLETCFIDNKTDMNVYGPNKDTIAQEIVDGIAEGFGLKKTEQSKPATNPTPKPTPAPKPSKKSVDEVAKEIINKPNYGGWGTGATRRSNLVAYNGTAFADAVQKRINELVSGTNTTPTPAPKPSKKSVDEVAKEIINKPNYGGWGTGATRVQRLTAYNGRKFAEDVQKRINELLK